MSNSATAGQELDQLRKLAQAYQVETGYESVTGEWREASPGSLVRILRTLGAPIERLSDAPDALRQRELEVWRQTLEPVTVAWDDESPHVSLRLPKNGMSRIIQARLQLEDGATAQWKVALHDLTIKESRNVDGIDYCQLQLPLPQKLPSGYHELTIELQGAAHTSLVISAPRRAFDPGCSRGGRAWGAFLPLYSLHSQRSWGSGDFTDLGELAEWVAGQGGRVVATLPILAAMLSEPFEPSPYSPASRLFWNDFYIDVEAIPELQECREARELLGSAAFGASVAELRRAPLVDYRRQMALKRSVLSLLAEQVQHGNSARRDAFQRFLRERPEVEDYARFRAVMDQRKEDWRNWPSELRDGRLSEHDGDEASRQYHRYAQWIAAEQVHNVATKLNRSDVRLYLDLPLGVNRDGYDTWCERSAFAVEASGGCPPDAVFTDGQNWNFPPLHPAGIRAQGYRYVRSYLRHQLEYADILRIDHVPVFHRLYWIPPGGTAHDGVYVRYPSEEMYAVFSLESHRHKVLLIGEDLGTVPPEVPAAMAEHHVHNMYVVQYALQPEADEALPEPPGCSVASLNTHDMPPFAAFVKGQDINERETLGLLGTLDPQREREQRQALIAALREFLRQRGEEVNEGNVQELMAACLAQLASSAAQTVLLNLEDLWLEEASQNLPGADDRVPNWQRKARYALEEFTALPEVRSLLSLMRAKFAPAPET
jgi:4-alpha-glucanotransferase